MPITFPGLVNIHRGEAVLTRGVIPNVQVVLVMPQDNLTLQPGQLSFADGNGGVLNLPDCLPLLMSMRQVKLDGGWMWAIEFLDHRHRWWGGQTVGGEWNRRLPDGSVDVATLKTPQELAQLCLDALDESGYTISSMPSTVYPYCDWRDNPPAVLALKQVCDACVCEVCGGELQAVKIWPAGSGPDLPAGDKLHETMRMTRAAPGNFRVVGGPTLYCDLFSLIASGYESNGKLTAINDLTYRPTQGWESEVPGEFFSMVTANRLLAKRSVWRVYQIDTDGDDVQFLNQQSNYGTNDEGLTFPLAPTVQGTFYPYSDLPQNVSVSTVWLGGFELDVERQTVRFPLPVYGIDGDVAQPSLTILISYYLKDATGEFEQLTVSGAGTGNGGTLVIHRPELFNVINEGAAGTLGTTAANAYIALYLAKYADNVLNDQSYAGIPVAALSGLTAQIVVMGSCLGDEGFTSRICRLEELAPLSPSEAERKRREIVARLRMERGL